MKWINGSGGGAEKSWGIWFDEENSHFWKLVRSSKLVYLLKCGLWVGLGLGMCGSELFRPDLVLNKPAVGIGNLVLMLLGTLMLGVLGGGLGGRFGPAKR